MAFLVSAELCGSQRVTELWCENGAIEFHAGMKAFRPQAEIIVALKHVMSILLNLPKHPECCRASEAPGGVIHLPESGPNVEQFFLALLDPMSISEGRAPSQSLAFYYTILRLSYMCNTPVLKKFTLTRLQQNLLPLDMMQLENNLRLYHWSKYDTGELTIQELLHLIFICDKTPYPWLFPPLFIYLNHWESLEILQASTWPLLRPFLREKYIEFRERCMKENAEISWVSMVPSKSCQDLHMCRATKQRVLLLHHQVSANVIRPSFEATMLHLLKAVMMTEEASNTGFCFKCRGIAAEASLEVERARWENYPRHMGFDSWTHMKTCWSALEKLKET